ncbi:coiled-coil domain-containing protein 126 isoform X1 [Dunckerocampus dactyliophorus]|uniref:coiled-coil domain-containing protein 126 isoform X1 n=1 Tax=Dunckerocampus dactyliophorus TaxID=161453 RepID=UPI002404BABC|nr:coiled-coil domain-containing protein 126 isoform X1 [Dunckerocampus dactyliophorus]
MHQLYNDNRKINKNLSLRAKKHTLILYISFYHVSRSRRQNTACRDYSKPRLPCFLFCFLDDKPAGASYLDILHSECRMKTTDFQSHGQQEVASFRSSEGHRKAKIFGILPLMEEGWTPLLWIRLHGLGWINKSEREDGGETTTPMMLSDEAHGLFKGNHDGSQKWQRTSDI